MGREALAAKKLISAGEHLQRAGVYYHFGKFLFVHDLPQMKAAHVQGGRMPHDRAAAPQAAGRARRRSPMRARRSGILRKPNGVSGRRC